MELEKARRIAETVKSLLEGSCESIEIAGSIRRRKPEVGDIELLCIPRFENGVDMLDKEIGALRFKHILAPRPNKRGRFTYGPKNKLMLHIPTGIGVDIFSTDEQCWWVSLAIRTGPKELNIAVANAAIAKGWRLCAYGSGFDTPEGHICCRSEREVFEAVGLPYREPWERD